MPLIKATGGSIQVKVWVVGQYRLVNQAFEALVAQLPGVSVVGQAASLVEVSHLFFNEKDCLVLWISLAGEDFDSLAEIEQQHLSRKVLLFSPEWTPQTIKESLKAGAAGCLSADLDLENLGDALRQIQRGEIYVAPELARDVILSSADPTNTASALSFDLLTPKENEILPLLCQGMSNKQIAQSLYLSVRTVENHLASIYAKLDVRSRTEAAVLAVQAGWSGSYQDKAP